MAMGQNPAEHPAKAFEKDYHSGYPKKNSLQALTHSRRNP